MTYDNMYFDKFGTVVFDGKKIKDLITAYDVINISDHGDFFEEYFISSSKTPDQISYDVYGDASYYWIPIVINHIKNTFYDFPLSDAEVKSIARQKAIAANDLSNFIKYYYAEEELNNAKRNIYIVKPSMLFRFLSLLQQA